MMKKIIMATLTLISTSALAHTGHVADESLHSALHSEHLMVLAAIILTAYVAVVFGRK